MAATLRDVAQRAHVSTSTVSRVLNNITTNIPISDETRQRVLQAAQEVGYKPNMAARQLARQQSFDLICVIVPHASPSVLTHPFYMSVVQGIARTCQQQGYAVTLYFADTNTPDSQTLERDYGRILDIPANGVILTTTYLDEQYVPRLLADNITFVHIGHLSGDTPPTTHFVDVDNVLGGRLATEHLLQKGHQRIATITGNLTMPAGQDRLHGYQTAMQQAGLSVPPAWIVPGTFDPDSGYAGMQQLLALSPRPTAVFAASDAMAIGAMQAIQEAGLTIPGDIVLVGFDDLPQAAHTTPPLTTVQQPTARLGEIAAELLLAQVTAVPAPPHIILQPHLIIRDST
ncbi:MAG: LacI family transcriptional regulator [Anaerolineae bacterium]|nr:LacI family transcriptional regulator [Anaerolineae bacterium]